MSLLRSLLRAEALRDGRARPAATVRHVHLSPEPMVFIPLRLAGEAAAPLGAMVGTDPDAPRLLVVPQPRDRALRFAFVTELAGILLPYIERFTAEIEQVPGRTGTVARCRDAPQLLVPNRGGLAFTRLLGRATRFRRPDGPYPVHPTVPALGRWLTFLHERSEFAGSAMLAAMTDLLAEHWVTGQSAVEDGSLAALLGWIDPPQGLTGPQAAAPAEDPVRSPPAGPDTDPGFDRVMLKPAIDLYAETGSAVQVEKALRSQLEPTWELMWRAVALLRRLPEAPHAAVRWERDRVALAGEAARVAEGALPQGRSDSAVLAARRLAALEAAHQAYEAQKALDDPLAMAEYRLQGLAFAGEVAEVDAARRITPPGGRRPVPRPLVTVRTADDPVRLAPGAKVVSPARPKQKAEIVRIAPGTVVVQLNGDLGRGAVPEPGRVPEPGERVCYAELDLGGGRRPPFPELEDTPWTHGGPPEEYVPTDDDAQEEWS